MPLIPSFLQVVPEGVNDPQNTPLLDRSGPGGGGPLEEDGGHAQLAVTGEPVSWIAPGTILPAWAIHVLATWPDLHPAWWQDEAFSLSAQGMGASRPERVQEAGGFVDPDRESRAAWEAVAARILAMDIKLANPDPSTVRGWQYGLRHSTSKLARQAQQKIEAHGFKPIDGYL